MKKLLLLSALLAISLLVLASQAGACGGWRYWPCE